MNCNVLGRDAKAITEVDIRAANMQHIYSQTSIQEVGLNLDFNQKLNTVGEHRFISKTFSYQHSTADFVSKIDTRLTRS
jgi:hypothetical protein